PPLEGKLLSEGSGRRPLPRTLRVRLRYGRGQQQLLPPARSFHLRGVEGTRPVRLPVRRQGQPLPDPHEEAEGPEGAAVPVFRTRAEPGTEARAGPLPASAALVQEHRPSGGVSRCSAEAAKTRRRVPGAELVRGRHLSRPRRRASPSACTICTAPRPRNASWVL